jgi:integrase
VKLTKFLVDKIEPPTDKDQAFYRDDQLKGFALRVTSAGTKSFIVEKNIGNKVRRMTLGKYGALTVEQARKEAQKMIGQIATGIDPIAQKRANKMNAVTLNEVFEDYMKARKSLKDNTLYNYKRVLAVGFSTWGSRPLISITKDKVTKHHERLGKERGEAYANLAMRLLRALFNFAAGQYEDAQGRSLVSENPVRRLSQTRAWYRIERRQTYIKAHELAVWKASIEKLHNEISHDYFILLLFTGLRRQEAATLTWEQIDLKAKTLLIIDTKNHQQHLLPLSDYLFALLSRRRESSIGKYVFPGTGSGGYLIEPKRQISKVIAETGIYFSCHCLRRTFITIAESLDIPAYALKRLMNHKMNGDITAGYIIADVERLRKPIQQITDYLLKCMGKKTSSEVVELSLINEGVRNG